MSDYTPTPDEAFNATLYTWVDWKGTFESEDDARAAWGRMISEIERTAAEKALTDLAGELSVPRKLWHGDSGVEVMVDERTLEMQKLTEWLRARAEAYRREGKE